MASVTLNPLIRSISGRLCHIVYYQSHGRQFARCCVVPRNPDTAAQRSRRELFAAAVRSWQLLDDCTKDQWNKKAAGIHTRGYNLYVSSAMRAVTAPFLPDGCERSQQDSSCNASSLLVIRRSVARVSMAVSFRYAAQSGRYFDMNIPLRAFLLTG
jgi:hypothetical protein